MDQITATKKELRLQSWAEMYGAYQATPTKNYNSKKESVNDGNGKTI